MRSGPNWLRYYLLVPWSLALLFLLFSTRSLCDSQTYSFLFQPDVLHCFVLDLVLLSPSSLSFFPLQEFIWGSSAQLAGWGRCLLCSHTVEMEPIHQVVGVAGTSWMEPVPPLSVPLLSHNAKLGRGDKHPTNTEPHTFWWLENWQFSRIISSIFEWRKACN